MKKNFFSFIILEILSIIKLKKKNVGPLISLLCKLTNANNTHRRKAINMAGIGQQIAIEALLEHR